MSELPEGWEITSLGDAFFITLGQSPPSSTYNQNGEGLPFFQGKSEFGKIYTTPKKWCTKPKKIAKQNDVLISVRAPVGPTNLAPVECCIGRGLASIRPMCDMDSKFILYFLRSIEHSISKLGTGTTFKAITGNKLKSNEIPLPPLPEQQRIVSKIEELFSKLDAGVTELEEAKTQLKRYRQSVLKSAVEGRLTEEWRKGHNPEPADKLLARIQTERKTKLGKKYKEPEPVDTTDLPKLPDRWEWIPLQLISDWANGKGLTKKKMQPGDFLVYGGNGINGYHNQYLVENECLVIGRVGAHCGNVNFALEKSWITDNAIFSKWLSIHIDIKFVQQSLKNMNLNNIAGGSGQPYVTQSLLNPLPFPLPSLYEQKQIVKEMDRIFSIIDETEQVIDLELKRAQSLRQAILKRAFEGKLVHQDPSDEPASELLERIKKEKY